MLSAIERGAIEPAALGHKRKEWKLAGCRTPVVGVTGPRGAGQPTGAGVRSALRPLQPRHAVVTLPHSWRPP